MSFASSASFFVCSRPGPLFLDCFTLVRFGLQFIVGERRFIGVIRQLLWLRSAVDGGV